MGPRDVSSTVLSLVSVQSYAHITVSFVMRAIDHLACKDSSIGYFKFHSSLCFNSYLPLIVILGPNHTLPTTLSQSSLIILRVDLNSLTCSYGTCLGFDPTPWHWPAEDIRDPETTAAWNCFYKLVLHSWVKTLHASNVNYKRASRDICFEFLNVVEFAASLEIWSRTASWPGGHRDDYLQNLHRRPPPPPWQHHPWNQISSSCVRSIILGLKAESMWSLRTYSPIIYTRAYCYEQRSL